MRPRSRSMPSTMGHKYANATKNSTRHDQKCKKFEHGLIKSILGSQSQLLSPPLLEIVDSPIPGVRVPHVVVFLGGIQNMHKRMLLSKIVFHWVSRLPTTNCRYKYQQPRTLVAYIRTLFGHFKDRFDWNYSFGRDFNFDGGLVPMLNKLFNDRRKEVGVAYGTANNVPKLVGGAGDGGNGGGGKIVTVQSMNFTVFDPDDPVEAMTLMMMGCRAFLGFRGIDEHTKLKRKHWVRDTFVVGHPYLCGGGILCH